MGWKFSGMRNLNQPSRLFESLAVIPTKIAKNLSLFKKDVEDVGNDKPAGRGNRLDEFRKIWSHAAESSRGHAKTAASVSPSPSGSSDSGYGG